MINRIFLNFLFLLLINHKSKHLVIFFISTLLVSILSSVIFISSSIKSEIFNTLNSQADFTIQKVNSGRLINSSNIWIDEFSNINGISNLQGRVYGTYNFKLENINLLIVGVDFFDKNINKNIQKLLEKIDISDFLSKDSMIIGNGVKKLFDRYNYLDKFTFKLENNENLDVKIFKDLPQSFNLVANDLIIMDINLAKKILNIDENEFSDIVFNVPNELERDNIKNHLLSKYANIRVIQKSEIAQRYENLFNYKGGIFLSLYIIVILTFILILYQRYSMINSSDKKEIGILKSVGWSIKEIIKLKLLESFIVAIFSFLLGIIVAYIFVFIFNAPLLINIFLGFENLQNSVVLIPNFDINLIVLLFLFFVVPFLSAVLIPVWKIASIDANESMK